jgi:hypothetical protein
MSKIFALAVAAMIAATSFARAHPGMPDNTILVSGHTFGAMTVTAIELPR